MFNCDAPYGRQTWNFDGYRWMFKSLKAGKNHTDKRVRENPNLFTDDVVKNYMGRNFAELALLGYSAILQK
ncbi:MAG: hypothetical protein ACLFUC_03410 [Bacteroidales bacterium]